MTAQLSTVQHGKTETPPPIVIAAINGEHLHRLSSTIFPMMDKAIVHSNGELSRDRLVSEIEDGETLLLTASQDGEILGMVVAKRIVFQTGKTVLSCPITSGGKIHLWMDEMVGTLKVLARLYGCSELYGSGRPGWERLMKNYGINIIRRTYALKLGE